MESFFGGEQAQEGRRGEGCLASKAAAGIRKNESRWKRNV
jgi:hypothetical protein